MEDVILFIVCVLAVYGLLSLAVSIFSLIPAKVKKGNGKIKMVLMVKDSEDIIEGIIRNIFTGNTVREFSTDGKLTVVDLGSKDGTLEILDRLKDFYIHMEVLDNEEKEKVFSDFD